MVAIIGSLHTQTTITIISDIVKRRLKNLPDGELNPGLPRDRRGYSPLYYRGLISICVTVDL